MFKIPARRSLVHFHAKNDIFSRSGENARMISSPNRETFYWNFSRSGDMSPDQEKYCLFLPIGRQMLISLADRQNTHNTICLEIAWQPILCYHFYVQSSFVFYEYHKFGFHLIFIFWWSAEACFYCVIFLLTLKESYLSNPAFLKNDRILLELNWPQLLVFPSLLIFEHFSSSSMAFPNY